MSYQDQFLRIDTPENVAFGYEVAGIGSRFLAALIDIIVITLLLLVVNFVALSVIDLIGGDGASEGQPRAWALAIAGILSFLTIWGYYIFFEMTTNGQSPGKRKFNLRVVRRDGTPITVTESIIRNLVRIVDFLPLFYGLGVVVMFIDTQSRRLGDLAGGTLVVYTQDAITLDSLDTQSALPRADENAPEQANALPVERLTSQDIHMAEEYFRRREELTGNPALVWQLVDALCRRMDIHRPAMSHDECVQFLADVLRSSRSESNQMRTDARQCTACE